MNELCLITRDYIGKHYHGYEYHYTMPDNCVSMMSAGFQRALLLSVFTMACINWLQITRGYWFRNWPPTHHTEVFTTDLEEADVMTVC